MKISIELNKLCIPMDEIVCAMSMDQKREILSWIATDYEVMKSVVDHIVGDDEFGWSTGDCNMRIDMLKRVEASQLSAGVQYNWRVWDELRQKIKDIRSSEHLYWILYHKISPEVKRLVFNELNKLGVESNYITQEGDEDVNKIRKYIEDAFKSMMEPVSTKPEKPELDYPLES